MMRHGSKLLTDPRWCRPRDMVCRRARLYRRRRSKVAMPARDHDSVVDMLMMLGADASLKNVRGRTASEFALQAGNRSRASLLEKHGNMQRAGSEKDRLAAEAAEAAAQAGVLRNAKLKGLKELRDQKLSKKNKKSKGFGGGAEGDGDAETAKEAQRAAEEAERRLLAEIASKEEAMEKQKALKAEAAATKLLASEEGGAEQTATKSKRQKQKAKQKKKQTGLGQVDHDAMLVETAVVMAGFAEVEGQQQQEACSPEVEFVDGDDDDGHGARAAKGGDTSLTIDEPTAPITAPAAPVAPPHEFFSPVVQPASTDEEPSARELTLICENNDLQSQLDATRRQLDELRRCTN